MSSTTYNNCHMPQYNGSDCGRMPIAMAYVPWQRFDHIYELDKALQVGTIFAELNKPFIGQGGNRNERRM